ncbi:MAG: tetratricopeptide repeat protein [Pseudomonadota bacterium]
MIYNDATGHDLSATDAAAVRAWDRTLNAFLAHGAATPVHLQETLDADPDFALAWAAKGLFYLLLGRSELVPVARDALAKAHASAAIVPLTPRELVYIDALEHYLSGRMRRAAALLDDHLIAHPADTLAMKLVQAIRFVLGDRQGMLASASQVLPAYGIDHPHRGYVLGCLAFAHEEAGDYIEAERLGRAGLEIAPDDAWGLHAVAHVYDMTARNDDGVRWLETQSDAWAHCNNFGVHVWWHLALFYLDKGDYAHVLHLYDTKIRAEHTDDYRDVANGASMLVRLEIEGVDVGTRWDELAEICANRVDDGLVIFADLHYLLALQGGERDFAADKLITQISASAQKTDHDMHEVAAIAGLPIATGLAAFRAGHYGVAHELLRQGNHEAQIVGGSHAQRDVFQRIMVEAAIRNGDWCGAERDLKARTTARGAEDGYTARRLERIGRLRAASVAAE